MNKVFTEPARQIPVVAEADVVVCGGGPGGFSAAIAAARHGAKTVLIERYGFLGGLASAGLISPLLAHTAAQSHTPIVEGLLREITERMHAIGGAATWQDALQDWGVRFDAEALKIVLDEMCLEAGVQLLLHSWLADVVMTDGTIAAAIVENKSGRQAVTGKLFVDATGDADVAYRAGAKTTHGRPFDQRPESMGSFFQLAGFARPSKERSDEIHSMLEKLMEEGTMHFYTPRFLDYNCAFHTDHTSNNATRYGGNTDDASDWTAAELSIRRDLWSLVRYLRQNVAGFEDCYVQQASVQASGRESRQIVGPYALTGDDVHLGRKFADAIARGSWWIDIHCPLGNTHPVHLCVKECPKGMDCPFWAAEHDNMRARADLYPPKGDWYDIPYRSLLSVSVPNLLSSGRCISATHEGMAGARVMGTCVAIGQAAGTAAALAIAAGTNPAALDVAHLQATLRGDGQMI
jgi:hypothetical protein